MGRYLKQFMGAPDITTPEINKDNFDEVMKMLEGQKGFIQIIAGNAKAYRATGHVDLIGQQGRDTELKGSSRENPYLFQIQLEWRIES